MNKELYPQSLLDIIEVVGETAALRLHAEYAGTRVFIPRKQIRPKHKLVVILGVDDAELMRKHFGGETISIPRAARAKRELRNIAIRAKYDAGERVPDIGQEYELTERQIYSILAQADAT